MRLRPSGRRQTPSASPTSLNCSFSHFSSARRSFSSATRYSACLLTRRDVRVPLLSDATTAISCFGGSGATQRLLQRTSTGTGEPSSKRHPVHCAKCHTARNPQVPATGRQYRQRDETCRTLNDNLPHHHKETRTDKRSGMNSWRREVEEEEEPNVNASASTSEGERDRHPAVRTRVEKRQKRKTKDKDEDERPKHHAVRANKYGQAGLEPRHSEKRTVHS